MTVHAATDRMRAVADLWERAAFHLGEAQGMTGGLTMAEQQTGIFAGVVTAYEPVLQYVRDRLGEGVGVSQEIRDILRQCVQNYEAEEVQQSQRFNGIG